MTTSTDTTDLDRFLDNPCSFFDSSYTAMHSLPRAELAQLQLDGVRHRFAQRRKDTGMVSKLAERQGVEIIGDFDDLVPLLFDHTMYKSYPTSFLQGQRFDQLTGWLAKLTSVDLSGVDASGCDSIESWLELLGAETSLDPTYTSGTSGTMSFIPWAERELEIRDRSARICELQVFGTAPSSTALDESYHYIASPAKNLRDYMAEVLTHGEPGLLHLRSAQLPNVDLLWLAARLRHAAASGDLSKVKVPASLLARRGEIEMARARAAESDEAWLDEVRGLQGERVLWKGFPYDMYVIARERLARGERWHFAPGSTLVLVGGRKGNEMPDDTEDTIREFVDARVVKCYGMVEMSSLNSLCEAGRYHLQPWIVPYALDPDTSKPKDRVGLQRGRFAFFDLLPDSHWGGLITGDDVEIDFDGGCPCGATSQSLAGNVERFNDRPGGGDKITCAATPEAYAEAMQFLASI